ncbi:hypothetical protein BDV93DRAFT_397208, partial [Ceratobasidium sp. AG-I]
LLQMCERAASAQHIDEIFSAHPNWNRAPYRLSLDGRSGIDHTNPASWTGDVIVGHVNLLDSWLLGRSQAADILKKAGALFEFDPAVLFAESPDIDLMRPFGKYPGIQIDNIEPDLQPVSISELVDDVSALETSDSGDLGNSKGSAPDIPQHLGDDELSIEQLLPATLDSSSDKSSRKGWIRVEDKWVHLESAVRYMLGLEAGAKSTDRLRRVCGFTRYLNSSTSP